MDDDIPSVRVIIPQVLRPFCIPASKPQNADLLVHARTIRELLTEIARWQPQVHLRICDEAGEPRRHMNVFVNDDHIRMRDGLDTRLTSGDLVTILPAVSGG